MVNEIVVQKNHFEIDVILAYDRVSDGTYRQIIFIISGPDKISCLFNKIQGMKKWRKIPNLTPSQST